MQGLIATQLLLLLLLFLSLGHARATLVKTDDDNNELNKANIQLESMKMSELAKWLSTQGIGEKLIDACWDEDDPRAAALQLAAAHKQVADSSAGDYPCSVGGLVLPRTPEYRWDDPRARALVEAGEAVVLLDTGLVESASGWTPKYLAKHDVKTRPGRSAGARQPLNQQLLSISDYPFLDILGYPSLAAGFPYD